MARCSTKRARGVRGAWAGFARSRANHGRLLRRRRRARRAGPEARADLCKGTKAEARAGLAERALNSISTAVDSLGRSPFIYRKAGQSPFLSELLIPFGHNGYVALFEIEDAATVTILAVRHQLEGDY